MPKFKERIEAVKKKLEDRRSFGKCKLSKQSLHDNRKERVRVWEFIH